MALIPFIDDAYVDSIIKSAGAYNPTLIKTQGVKLRELFKLMRDRMEQGDLDVLHTVGDEAISGMKLFNSGLGTRLVNFTNGSSFIQLSSSQLTASRLQTLQDKSGVIALVSDLGNYLPLSGGSMTGNMQFTDQENTGIRWDRYTDYSKIFFESINAGDPTPSGSGTNYGRSNLVFLLGDDGYNQDHFVFRYHQNDATPVEQDTFVISNDYLYMRTLLDGTSDHKVLTIGDDRKIKERIIGRGSNQIMAHNENGDTNIGRTALIGVNNGASDDVFTGVSCQLTNGYEANTISKAARMQLGSGGDIVFKTFTGPGDGTGNWSDRLRIKNISGTLDYSADVSANYNARSIVDKAYVDAKVLNPNDIRSLGAWDALINVPVLTTTPAAVGKFYEVSTGGKQSVTGAAVIYQPNDKLVSNGTSWQYIPYTNTNGAITNWVAQAYKVGSYVNYLGKDWISTAPTLASDVPSNSLKWIDRLYSYDGLRTTKTINLYNSVKSKVGYILSNGGLIAYSGFTSTDLMPVTPGKIYAAFSSTSFVPIPSFRYYWIDATGAGHGVFLQSDSNGITAVAPDNAVALQISFYSQLKSVMIVEGTDILSIKPSKYVKYGYILNPTTDSQGFAGIDFIKDALTEQTGKNIIVSAIKSTDGSVTADNVTFLTHTLNYYNPNSTTRVAGAYINTSGYYMPTGSPTQQVYKFKAKPNTRYSFYNDLTMVRDTPGLQITDKDGTVRNVANSNYSSLGYYTTSDTVDEIWLNTRLNQIYYSIVIGENPPATFTDYGYNFTNDILGQNGLDRYPWMGKNIGCLGDSITVQGYYFTGMLAETKSIKTYTEGQNGQVIAVMGNGLTAAAIANLDIITILAGTNDYGHGGATVGNINSPADATTIYGSIKLVVNRISALKPNVRIVFFTPFNRGTYGSEGDGFTPNSNGLTIKIIADAIHDCCKHLGIPSFDLLSHSGITSFNLDYHLQDKLHPNAYGGDRIGKLMGQFINTLPVFG